MTTQLGGYLNLESAKTSERKEVTLTSHADGKAGLDVTTLLGYMTSDTDEASDTKYYGFLNADGKWYIYRWNTITGEHRYVRGDTGYIAAWTARADVGTVYDYWDVVF